MDLTIQVEEEKEYQEIFNLVKLAFQNAENADGDEQDYVNNLRNSKAYIPDLALTIKGNSKIVGHIMLTETFITRKDGVLGALLLSPVCVLPEFRNMGIASLLIRFSLLKAAEMGYKAVFLVGEPEFYRRFGFLAVRTFGIVDSGNIPEKYTLGLELTPGYLASKGGIITIC